MYHNNWRVNRIPHPFFWFHHCLTLIFWDPVDWIIKYINSFETHYNYSWKYETFLKVIFLFIDTTRHCQRCLASECGRILFSVTKPFKCHGKELRVCWEGGTSYYPSIYLSIYLSIHKISDKKTNLVRCLHITTFFLEKTSTDTFIKEKIIRKNVGENNQWIRHVNVIMNANR